MLSNFIFRKLANSSIKSCRTLYLSSSTMSAKIAVVLSGCGVYDGSEIHEASACLVHLSRAKAEVSMFAPNVEQMHVIDHTKGTEMKPARNVLVESARIARGNVKPLSELNVANFDGLVFPGGFGAAKNLCTWAVDDTKCSVNSEVEKIIKDFHKEGKPQAFSCIAPVLAAKCISGVELTVGHTEEEDGKWPYAGTAAGMEKCGAKHVVKEVTETHVDHKNKVISTPAYMCNTDLHEIFDGIGAMIKSLMKLAKK